MVSTRDFDSLSLSSNLSETTQGIVAQQVEQQTFNLLVEGSIPSGPIKMAI